MIGETGGGGRSGSAGGGAEGGIHGVQPVTDRQRGSEPDQPTDVIPLLLQPS
jgi:hypothetical protein